MSEKSHNRYAHPPITEAVVELRSDQVLTNRELERCRDRFKRRYEKVEDLNEIALSFENEKTTHKITPAGHKLTASNAVDLILLNPTSLVTIRLAPYISWENLIESASENFETYAKVVGRRRIIRIGARFVNRIDIPNDRFANAKTTDFLTVGVSIPSQIADKVGNYFFNAHTRLANGINIVIQSGIAPPALIDHTSILLDIDASIDEEMPARIEDMWQKAGSLRAAKNLVFENSITDLCRDLFR